PVNALVDLGRHLILPVITLVFVSVAGDSRFVRAAMIDSLHQDFVRTARAKGLAERKVVFRHAFRNALLPVLTNVALELQFLFGGAIATETIFSWPGMGLAYIQAVRTFDYPVLMGILVITALVVVLANLLADILYAVVDPRISYGYRRDARRARAEGRLRRPARGAQPVAPSGAAGRASSDRASWLCAVPLQ